MHHFQQRQRLCPFAEYPDAWIHSAESNERYEENDAPENGEPEDGVHEVVEDEVLRLGGAGLEGFGPGLSRSLGLFLGIHG